MSLNISDLISSQFYPTFARANQRRDQIQAGMANFQNGYLQGFRDGVREDVGQHSGRHQRPGMQQSNNGCQVQDPCDAGGYQYGRGDDRGGDRETPYAGSDRYTNQDRYGRSDRYSSSNRYDSGAGCGGYESGCGEVDGFTPLTAKRDGSDAVMTTPGGYTIRGTANDANTGGTLEITGPGPDFKRTLIKEDPHALIDKDGKGPGGYQAAFDYKNGLTIELPDGTEIKTRTQATADGKASFLKEFDVINGGVGVRVTGLNEGRDALRMTQGNGRQLDALTPDGNTVGWNRDGSGEYSRSNGFGGFQQVDQAFIDQAEAGGYPQAASTNGSNATQGHAHEHRQQQRHGGHRNDNRDGYFRDNRFDYMAQADGFRTFGA